MKLEDKIKKVGKNDFLKTNIEYDDMGNVVSIKCWKCGKSVAGYVDDTVTETKVINGERHHYIRQKFCRNANYAQVRFELDNGSKYEPVFCKDCAPSITKEDGEKVLVRDAEIAEKKGRIAECYLYEIKEHKGVK